jgi:hypothetical protein
MFVFINHTDMHKFEINFPFKNRRVQAEVSVLKGDDHIQYTISPIDEHLLEEFGSQVIHEFPGKSMEPAFPGLTKEKKEFADALAKGLKHFLENR